MSFSNKEQGQVKEALLPSAKDIDALVRAEHHDPFSILGPHGDGGMGQRDAAAKRLQTGSGRHPASLGALHPFGPGPQPCDKPG